MSYFSSLAHVAGGCLRRDSKFLLGVEAPLIPPAGRVVTLPARRTLPQLPDRWQLATVLGDVWDAGRAIVGDGRFKIEICNL